MQARVMTCLHLTDSGSLNAAELVRRLDVSPASISTAVRALEQRDLLRRERDSRRDRYWAITRAEDPRAARDAMGRSLIELLEGRRSGASLVRPGRARR